MSIVDYYARARGRYYRTSSRLCFRRPFRIGRPAPLISFTFDDFPRSALSTGGAILNGFGVKGTYYASFGLMGKEAPTGEMFVAEDVNTLFAQGHELGCHTFGHCHSAETAPGVFEDSVMKNQEVLQKWFPGALFHTFSYPISPPKMLTKRRVARHFRCCRGGGQTFNSGTADLNYLAAYFLEKSRDKLDLVKSLMERNQQEQGWLILATHDISETPTPFGCTPGFFEEVVRSAVRSGARILPVMEAWQALGGGSNS